MKKSILVCTLALFAGAAAHANIILSEAFNYPNGDIASASGSPWTVHSGATPVTVTNNQAQVSFSRDADISAPLSGVPYDTVNNPGVTALYASFKANFIALPGSSGNYFAHFKDEGTFNFRCRIYALTPAGSSPGKFRLGIASTNSVSTTAGFISYPTELSTNTTYLVVVRYDLATGNSTLWIDPTAEGDTSVSSPQFPGTILGITRFAFRQASGEGTSWIDDLRVGTGFADVAGPNNPPSISSIAGQHTAVGVSTPAIAFTVGDQETPANALVVTAVSSAPSLVPNANIVLGGSGANRTVAVTPTAAQQGYATITVTVTDGNGTSASTSFQLAVGIPTISGLSNLTTPIDTVAGPIPFTVGDTETPAGDLTVTAISSNQGLLPDGNVSFGGSGANRTLTITPAAAQTGLATVTVIVSDGTSTATNKLILTVNPLLGLIRTDNFDRPDGPLVTGNGEWLSAGSSGQLQITGNRILVTSQDAEDVSTELPPGQVTPPVFATASGTILYASFTITFTNLPSSGGTYFAHLKADGFDTSNFRCRIFAMTSGADAGKFRLGVANNAANISGDSQFPADLSLDTTYLVVIRYNVGLGESRLWVNPVAESGTHVTAVDNPSAIGIGAFTFRQASGMGAIFVDDLKIGTSFSDVVTVTASYSLAVANSGADVEIRWPLAATGAGFNLQFSNELVPSGWTDYPGVVDVQGSDNVVRLLNTTGHKFFRLRKP